MPRRLCHVLWVCLREVGAEIDSAARKALITKGFELVARRIARPMCEKYAIVFVNVGDW